MRQYPIWNIITACIYNITWTSYREELLSINGVKDTGEVDVRVGTSSSKLAYILNILPLTAN